MDKRGHVLNGLLLGIGLGYVLEPSGGVPTFLTILEVTPPVVLGAMVPDIDTAFGTHRKTLHNLPVLAFFYAYPTFFGNLSWVWVGVLSHYVLDVVGSRRGLAWFYPYPEEYGLPFGVTTDSPWAGWVTGLVTVAELAIVYAVVELELPVTDLARTATEAPTAVPLA